MFFLQRCINENVLLPSNYLKGINLDLLLLQRKRKVVTDIKNLRLKVRELDIDSEILKNDVTIKYQHDVKNA